jgi:hypothetical protein
MGPEWRRSVRGAQIGDMLDLWQAQGARQLAACILHEHRRRQNAGDGQKHQQEIE